MTAQKKEDGGSSHIRRGGTEMVGQKGQRVGGGEGDGSNMSQRLGGRLGGEVIIGYEGCGLETNGKEQNKKTRRE